MQDTFECPLNTGFTVSLGTTSQARCTHIGGNYMIYQNWENVIKYLQTVLEDTP